MSGNDNRDEQFVNIPLRFIRLFVFHLEIFGNFFNNVHLLNISSILITFSVFHLDKSGKDNKFSQRENIPFI